MQYYNHVAKRWEKTHSPRLQCIICNRFTVTDRFHIRKVSKYGLDPHVVGTLSELEPQVV